MSPNHTDCDGGSGDDRENGSAGGELSELALLEAELRAYFARKPAHGQNHDGPRPGARFGPFAVEECVGTGAFARVFRAIDTRSGCVVALKVPNERVLVSDALMARFEREAKAASSLNHVHIVAVYDTGREGLIPYISCRFCEGVNLACWLRDRPGPLPPASAARLVAVLAGAVQHAHDWGVLHRDLKPANILLERAQGDPDSLDAYLPVLIDFGMARMSDDLHTGTATGDLLGTPQYMAPEQAAGRNRDVGPPTDVYGLGAILYRLLTGRPPFQGECSTETRLRVIMDDPIAPRLLRPGLARPLETICLKCLAREPRRRYPSAAALAEDLERFLSGRPITGRPVPARERLWRWARRHPRRASAAALGVIAILGLIVGLTSYSLAIRKSNQAIVESLARSEQQRRQADLRLYASEIRRAAAAERANRRDGAQRILHEQIPEVGDEDHREFAWWLLHDRLDRDVTHLWGDYRSVTALASLPDPNALLSYASGEFNVWDLRTRLPRARFGGLPPLFLDWVGPLDGDHRYGAFGRDPRSGRAEAWLLNVDGGRVEQRWAIPGAGLGRMRRVAGRLYVSLLSSDWDRPATYRDFELVPGRAARPIPVEESRDIRRVRGRGDFLEIDDARDAPRLATLERDIHIGVPPLSGQPDPGSGSDPDSRASALMWDLPGGRRMAVLRSDGELSVIDRERSQERILIPAHSKGSGGRSARARSLVLAGSRAPTEALAVALDDQSVDDPRVLVWDLATSGPPHVFPRPLMSNPPLTFVGDGGTLAVGGALSVRLWNWRVETAEPAESPLKHTSEAWALAFAPGGGVLASGGDDNQIRLWNPETGAPGPSWTAHPDTVGALAYRPDGKVLASVSLGESENVRLWDARTHRQIATLTGHVDKVRAVAFSPDGRLLATGGSDLTIRLWDGDSGRPRGVLEGHRDKIRALALWSGRLVSVCADATMIVWNIETGRPQRSLALTGPGAGLAVAADGATIATSDEVGTITLWDTRSWQSRTIHGEGAEIRSLAFAPDGRTLAGAGLDRNVHLWHVEAGIEMLALRGHLGQVNGVAFSPIGRLLVSAGHEGQIRLWRAR